MNMERQPTRLSNWTFTWKTSQFNIERFKVTNRTSSRATSRKESCQYIKHLHHDRHTDRETDRRTSAFIRQTENLTASQTRAEKYRHSTPKFIRPSYYIISLKCRPTPFASTLQKQNSP